MHKGSLGQHPCVAALMLAEPAARNRGLKDSSTNHPTPSATSGKGWLPLLQALLDLIDGGGTEGLPDKFVFTVVVRGRDGETRAWEPNGRGGVLN